MTPQLHLDGRDRLMEEEVPPVPASAAPTTPHAMTDVERQGLAMGWVSIALGLFLLFGGLALWSAVALNAGFIGWLIGMALIGLVIVATLSAVTYTVMRPRR
jgi:hypothetical protein